MPEHIRPKTPRTKIPDESEPKRFFHENNTYKPLKRQYNALLENGKFEITLYSSCCNADKGIYYYTTYENRHIRACLI